MSSPGIIVSGSEIGPSHLRLSSVGNGIDERISHRLIPVPAA